MGEDELSQLVPRPVLRCKRWGRRLGRREVGVDPGSCLGFLICLGLSSSLFGLCFSSRPLLGCFGCPSRLGRGLSFCNSVTPVLIGIVGAGFSLSDSSP